jgi:hypothetical protein
VNFRGNPDTNYLQGTRYEIPFFMISSDDFQKTEEELLAYEMPLTEVIERNSVKDIQRIEDSKFISTVDANIGSNTATVTYSGGQHKKASFESLFNFLDSQELRAETILMSNTMFNKLFLWDATSVGDAVGSEVSVNGYSYSTLFGRKLIVSNKVSLLRNSAGTNDHIYTFTSQEFLGNFFVLNDTKFFIEKKKNVISFSAYETLGMGIGNTKSMGRLVMAV